MRESAGEHASGRAPSATRRDAVACALVALLCGVAVVAAIDGPYPYDPAYYFRTGVDFPTASLDLFTLRIGLIAPVAAAVALLGPSEAALYAVPVLSAILLAAAVFAATLFLFGERVLAAASALLAVAHPVYLVNAPHIFPDTTATATFAAGFACLVVAAPHTGPDVPRRIQVVAVLAAGGFFGWTYLVREFSPLVLLPAVAGALVFLGYGRRRAGAVAGAALAVAALELVYGLVRYGRPFVHLDLLVSRGDEPVSRARLDRMERIQEQVDGPLDSLLVLPRLLTAWESGWALLVLLAAFALALAVVRDRRLAALAAWCFGFWAVMAVVALVTVPPGRWLVNVTNVRYWYPILPPLVIGGLAGIALLARAYVSRVRSVAVAPVLVVAVALATLLPGLAEYRGCAERDVWRSDPAGRWHDLRAWLATPEAERYDVVWTDVRSYNLLPAYTTAAWGRLLWEGQIRVFPGRDETAVRDRSPRSLVLLHAERLPRFAESLAVLRGEWTPVFASGDGHLVVLAKAGTLAGHASATVPRPNSAPNGTPGTCGLSPYEHPASA